MEMFSIRLSEAKENRRQDCAKRFDEQMIIQLIEQEERMKKIFSDVSEKERGHVCR